MILTLISGIPGTWQIIVILIIVLLLFGGKKIPELMKGLGKGIKEFKEGMNPDKPKSKKDKDSTQQNNK
ncbi:MAG: twin-arginine translocase TatA/TatE family subunit [Bacteroidales bacterium]|nr:twin-arginine translocase TatA/TatE family subunit [Bacteroidales bacterium]